MTASHPGKPGSRIAWVAILGAAAIGAALYLRSRPVGEAPAAASAGTPATAVETATGPVAAKEETSALSQKASSRDADTGNFRTRAHDDGSREEFRRDEDGKTLTRVVRNASGSVERRVIYHLGQDGLYGNGEIFDGEGTKVATANYTYSTAAGPTFGKVVEEQLFDAQIPQIIPGTTQEQPVRRLMYTYQADGSGNEPIPVTLQTAGPADERLGKDRVRRSDLSAVKPTALSSNPFADVSPADIR